MDLRQDLILYKDGSIVSPTVSKESGYLSVVRHAPGTYPLWFIATLLSVAATNTAKGVNHSLKPQPGAGATLVSFTNNRDFYALAFKLVGPLKFEFIDCFSHLFDKQIPDPENATKLIATLFQQIQKQAKGVLVIDGVELLQMATNILTIELTFHLQLLLKTCSQVWVITSDPLTATEELYENLLWRSHLVVHFKPLDTGRAKDITGLMTVTRGPVPAPTPVAEEEWIYHLSAKEFKISVR